MNIRIWPFAIALPLLASWCGPASASDPAANALVKLFIDACVPNMGQPERVQAWAEQRHLQTISAPAALAVFVGPGGKGSAWAVPSGVGNFALSIRGETQACAVWARAADPSDVEAAFNKLVEGVRRPGIETAVDKDVSVPSPVGDVRSRVIRLWAPPSKSGLMFTMLTAERSGGAFQASIQVARFTLP